DRDRERWRQMPAERVGNNAPRVVEREAQRHILGAPAGRGAEDAGADADAHDRQSTIEKVSRQPQFRAEARNQIAADNAFRAGTEQNETVKLFCARRNRSAGCKRPAISEANITAFEM